MTFEDEIKQKLAGCSKSFVVVFAYRCALRSLPVLGKTGNFDFWSENNRKQHLFSILRVYDVLEFISLSDTNAQLVRAAVAAVADAADAYADADAYAADAVYAAAYAAAAGQRSVNALSTITLSQKNIQKQILSDLNGTQDVQVLIHQPLWDKPPKKWLAVSKQFEQALTDIGFTYWATIYTRRIAGKTDLEALKTRAILSKEIRRQSPDEITRYLISLTTEGSQRLKEVKVVFLGDGGAGKTSLINKIFNLNAPLAEQEAPTPGVDIRPWQPDGLDLKAHLWDFGGQVIMHATHQFFMTQRSLYVIVLDGRKEQDPNYWLHHTKTFGGGSPVLVVINKVDQHAGDLERNTLKTQYKAIHSFHAVSCATNQGLVEFIQALQAQLTQLVSWKAAFPTSWFAVKEALQARNEDFISIETYHAVCTEFKVKEEDTKSLLKYLNDLGIMLHFDQLAHFNTHVLNPRWLTQAVYQIINSEALTAGKGMLDFTALDEILPDNNSEYFFPRDKYAFIMEMMQHFELCYRLAGRIQSSDRFLIPDLLDKDQPNPLGFDRTQALCFRFTFEFLPRAVIARFIVNLAEDIQGQNRWRYGVVLQNASTASTALVIANQDQRRVDVWVKGFHARLYFSVIRDTLHKIFATYEHFKVNEQMLIDEATGHFIDYAQLLGLERMGQATYSDGILGKTFEVNALLDGVESSAVRQEKALQQQRPHEQAPIHVEVKNYVDARTSVHVNIDIKNHAANQFQGTLQLLKEDALLEVNNPTEQKKLAAELAEVEQAIQQVAAAKSPDALATSSVQARLSSWLGRLDKANTRVGKAIKAVEGGVDLANSLIKNYNKIAPWLGYPAVPEIKKKAS